MKKFIKVNFMILVIFSLIAIKSFANETEDTSQDIENIQDIERVNELEGQKQELEEQTEYFNNQLEFINEELSATLLEVSELTQSIYDKQTEIEELTAKSDHLTNQIKEVELELDVATESYEKQKKLLEKRLIAMYEMGDTTYLDLLLSSKGISDFLSNYYYISEIATTDSELLNIVKEQKENIQNLMDKLQKSEKKLETARFDLEKAKIAISNMVIIKNQRVQDLTLDELELQMKIEEYQAQIQEIESEIRILALINGNSEFVGGRFVWPVPGYTRISSQFGLRTHPITGVYKLHTGVDIGAPEGTSFVATNHGIVTKAAYNIAYGNMVIVDHGGGVSTLYAHGSEILVQEGQAVTQGMPILKVGSTGYSTGPHAHFEIRINGAYVNPIEYLMQESFQDEDEKTEEIELNVDNEVDTNE